MDTLEKLDKSWIAKLETAGWLMIPVGLVIGLLLAYFKVVSVETLLIFTLAPSFIVEMLARTLLYKTVRCPECRENLAKYKNGKNIPIKDLYTYFSKEAPCRHCGWK